MTLPLYHAYRRAAAGAQPAIVRDRNYAGAAVIILVWLLGAALSVKYVMGVLG